MRRTAPEHRGNVGNVGNPLIQDKKSYDGTIYFVEEVRNKRGELAAKTLWKTRSAIADAAKNSPPTLTSETLVRSSEQGNTSISNPDESTKTPWMLTQDDYVESRMD